MSRLALCIEYDGQRFNGWQSQDHGRTVQQTLEMAISRVADEQVTVQCAGRTDTGVHAIHQIVHMDCNVERKMHSWLLGTNSNLPNDISVQWVKPVNDKFHARFSAKRRSYRYIILNSSSRSALLHGRVSWEPRQLNIDSMQSAAVHLLGEHDFTSYRAVACQAKSPVRTVHQLNLFQTGELIVLDINANAFLHHMVRNIAGVLMAIGIGKERPEWAHEVLMAKDRTLGAMTAPAAGLYLSQVYYEDEFAIPAPKTAQWPMCIHV